MVQIDPSSSRLLLVPETIEGIGHVHAAALDSAAIATLGDLLRLPAWRVAVAVSHASPAAAAKWQAAAHLLQVDGVDPDVAEALVEGGVQSVGELAEAGLRTLELALERAVAARRIRSDVSLYRLAALQRAAAKLVPTGIVLARLVDADSRGPIAGARVRCGGARTETDAEGRIVLPAVPTGVQEVQITLERGRYLVSRVVVASRRVASLKELRVRARRAAPLRELREAPGRPILFARACVLEYVETTLADLPDPTHLVVRRLDGSGEARLVHLYRRRIGRALEVERVRVPAARLPDGARVGSVLELAGGALVLTTLGVKDVHRKKIEGLFPGDLAEGARRRVRRS
jgi:hypothetical protein